MCTLLAATTALGLLSAPVRADLSAIGGPWDAPVVPQASAEQSAVGTLDQVDVAASQIVVATGTEKLTFRLQTGATIRQGSTKLSPAALAAHKGERVKVRYREAGGVRRAEWVVVAPGRPAKRSDASSPDVSSLHENRARAAAGLQRQGA